VPKTRVTIVAGICGFTTNVEVSRVGRRRVSVVLCSECEMVDSMTGQFEDLGWMEALASPADSLVWQCACRSLQHPSCPVPTGILKAIEVELELTLAKYVVVHFDDTSDD
jgi:hypothetical protein